MTQDTRDPSELVITEFGAKLVGNCMCGECVSALMAAEIVRLRAQLTGVREALRRASNLVPLVTVRQVIDAGDEAINAAGLNCYCMSEGLADAHEPIGVQWWIDAALGGDDDAT